MQTVRLTAEASVDCSATSNCEVSEDELISIVLRWVREHSQSEEINRTPITPETDLIASGILNSFGFLDLLLFLEGCLSCRIDLDEVEPSDIAIVKGLCRVVSHSRGTV
jgi:acyl carrier protein